MSKSGLYHGNVQQDDFPDHANSYEILHDIRCLLKEQNGFLLKIDKRQAEADISIQPVPTVPARSSSAWNPLLMSTLKNTEPTLERWRGGLDTLLIFVGLFSAIITSFLVESLKNLEPDAGLRTNELLANLTGIIIAISTLNDTGLELTQPASFVPTSSDVRINIYWSLALIISISVAALAVAGRAFLALLIRSEGDAVARLTEIQQRWATAKLYLGPFLQALPQVLMIPFALFVVGLLDLLFSKSIMATRPIRSISAAAIAAAILVATVGALLCVAVLHGIKYPRTSPFQTSLSHYMVKWRGSGKQEEDEDQDLTLSNRRVFHMALQQTFEDEALDQASAALDGVMHTQSPSEHIYNQFPLPDLEFRTLLHLLSPEASLRSNLSAAQVIRKFDRGSDDMTQRSLYITQPAGFNPYQRSSLLIALLRAAERHLESRPHMVNGHANEVLTTAMISLVPSRGRIKYPHPILNLLSANYLTRHVIQPIETEIIKSYRAVMWHGISTFIRLLEVHLESHLPTNHARLDSVVVEVLGHCSLTPEDGRELLLSMMNNPTMTQKTSYQDSVDFDTVAECLVRWVAKGENALEMALEVVDKVLLEYFNPDPLNYRPAHRSYPRAVRHVMMLVYESTQVSSLKSLMFCTKFILKVEETFIWDVGRFLTLRIISRFLALLNDNYKGVDERDAKSCKNALTYVYRWTLYRASSFGEYDIDIPGFHDNLPPREVFLSELRREWAKLHSIGCVDTLSVFSKMNQASTMIDATYVPLPLPGWGLDDAEDIPRLSLDSQRSSDSKD